MSIVRIASLAGLAASATALAGPTTPDLANLANSNERGTISPRPEGLQAFCETFNACPGPGLYGCNGWEPWYGAAADGQVQNGPAGSTSGGKALRYVAALNDCVHFMNFTGGKFYASAMTFYPTNAAVEGEGYIILCNDYINTGPPTVWASQVKFTGVANTVSNDAGGFALAPTLPLIRGQWVLWEAEIDLVNDRFHDVYGGQQLTLSENITPGVIMKWTDNALNTAGSPAEIQIVDLFSNGVEGMWIDDFTVTCFADLDQSTGCGTVDIFDFLKFSNYFDANNPIACNADTSTGLSTCDIFDFLEFSNLFDQGCD